jgi:BolA protein
MTQINKKNVEDTIQEIIEREFPGDKYELINESYKHAGHAGDDGSGQTHFKLKVVSSRFEGLSRVDSQRLINGLLSPSFDSGLHAISLSCSHK